MTSIIEEKSFLEKAPLLTHIPQHVAIITDGNRRWAKKRGLPSLAGHNEGSEVLTKVVQMALALKIRILTVFAFSTENWLRSSEEIDHLMNLFEIYLMKQQELMKEKGVRLETIGDLTKCSLRAQKAIAQTKEMTKEGKNLDLVLAINYGGRDEISRAAKKLCIDCKKGKIKEEEFSEELFSHYLDTAQWKDPDLLIRTSGEERLSNFLLWQLSYSEVYMTKTLWPDFSQEHFFEALKEYQKRKRRFGI